jgi:hypothetical protein
MQSTKDDQKWRLIENLYHNSNKNVNTPKIRKEICRYMLINTNKDHRGKAI